MTCNIIIKLLIITLIMFDYIDLSWTIHDTSCPIKRNSTNSNETSINQDPETEPIEYYSCPGKTDPIDHLKCCDFKKCCPIKSNYIFFPIQQKDMPYVIVIGVLLACFVFITTLTLCFFWPICPLFNTCRVRYYHDESGCADKLGENTQTDFSEMPCESPILGNCVVIAKYFDSDSIEEKRIINASAGDCLIGSTKNLSTKSNDSHPVNV